MNGALRAPRLLRRRMVRPGRGGQPPQGHAALEPHAHHPRLANDTAEATNRKWMTAT